MTALNHDAWPPLSDMEMIEASPYLKNLVGEGVWNAQGGARDEGVESWLAGGMNAFRKQVRALAEDTEEALFLLRRFRIITLLDLAREDFGRRRGPTQVRAQLRRMNELLLTGAWIVAERELREKFVHPIVMERRNVQPPIAIFSLSRLGALEPFYTTFPSPLFVHSRAASFSPALGQADFDEARRQDKEWLPAREYFLRLARRIIAYLWSPVGGGMSFHPTCEDHVFPGPAFTPGPAVVRYAAFGEHFLENEPLENALGLMRLSFIAGKKGLGRSVEEAARAALARLAGRLGPRLRPLVKAYFVRKRHTEGLAPLPGGMLDIEQGVRLAQLSQAPQRPGLLASSTLKSIELLAQHGLLSPEEKLILTRAYNWQWHIINRLAFLGLRHEFTRPNLKARELDSLVHLKGASDKCLGLMTSAEAVLKELRARS